MKAARRAPEASAEHEFEAAFGLPVRALPVLPVEEPPPRPKRRPPPPPSPPREPQPTGPVGQRVRGWLRSLHGLLFDTVHGQEK